MEGANEGSASGRPCIAVDDRAGKKESARKTRALSAFGRG
ncbi:hypothetical protein A33M_2305 [Rhodovulum sp. PH10]|nr:hypothetical protein A33M_2305 [Rhodovulum sp. PH10]